MSSLLCSAVALFNFCLAASAYGVGERQASKTTGYGEPHLVVPAQPTEGPSWDLFHDLLKIKPRVVTNICSEWTLLGVEGGQPACTGSSTCLFDTISGFGYEACALTSSSYYQVTECWNYPETYAVSPLGQIFCGAAAPYCGYYEFVFDNGDVFSNFGCSASPYSSTATLLPGALSSYTPDITDSVITTGVPTVISTETPVVVVTAHTTTASTTATSQPTLVTVSQNSPQAPKKSSHLGAVVGGTVAGIAVIGIVAAILGCCLYKRRKSRKQEEAQAAVATAAAFQAATAHNNDKPLMQPAPVYPELTGLGLAKPQMTEQPPMGVIYTTEKPTLAAHNQEINHNAQQHSPQSPLTPPPLYNQPSVHNMSSTTPPVPSQTFPQAGNYSELGGNGIMHVVSPIGAFSTRTSTPQGELSPRPQSSVTEMSGVGIQQTSGQLTYPANGASSVSELPASQQHLDMSGAPMSENYHELHAGNT